MTRGSGVSVVWMRALAFLRRDLLFETSYRLQSLFRLLTVFFQILVFYFLAQLIGGEATDEHLADYGHDYFTFTLIGIAATGFFNAGLITFTTSLRQQLTIGVMEAMVVTPIGAVSLLMYSLLFPMLYELLKSLVYIVLGVLLLGARVELADPWQLLLTVALSVLVFSSLGVLAGNMILHFKRGDPIAWFLSGLTSLVGGVFFPLSVLPGWLSTLAYLLPVPYALDALRACLIPGASRAGLGTDLLALAGFAVMLLPLAAWTSARVMRRARVDGSLGLY